jgi:hypothetical protein
MYLSLLKVIELCKIKLIYKNKIEILFNSIVNINNLQQLIKI